MDKGAKIYRQMIDEAVEKSKKCVAASIVQKGEAKGGDAEKLNKIFSKLTEEERKVLAKFVLDSYSDGMYDLICDIEWYIDCKDMKITVEGEELPTTRYEGLGNDYIGRREGWEWPEN